MAGTGLGLSICKGFVEAMGGTIFATNRADRPGAIFTAAVSDRTGALDFGRKDMSTSRSQDSRRR